MSEHRDVTKPENARAVAWEASNPPRLKTRDGTEVEHPIYLVDGTPCIMCTSDDGTDYYVPLIGAKPRRKGSQFTVEWVLPDDPLVPAHLWGASLTVRQDRNA